MAKILDTSAAEFEAIIGRIGAGLQYEAFDTALFRRVAYSHGSMRAIVAILSAIAVGGHKLSKISVNRSDPAMATSIVLMMTEMGITQTKGDKFTSTLNRYAIAFAPLYAVIRQNLFMKKLLIVPDNQGTPDHLCDLAFNGFKHLDNYRAATAYIQFFSHVIAKATDDTYDRDEVDERIKKFHEIGKAGLSKDLVLAKALNVDPAAATLTQMAQYFVNEANTVSYDQVPSAISTPLTATARGFLQGATIPKPEPEPRKEGPDLGSAGSSSARKEE